MFKIYLIICLVIALKKVSAQIKDNFCSENVEKTKLENGEIVKYQETIRKCCEGYITVRQQCKPYCANCSNGICIRPHHCECNVGYVWNSTSRSCELICYCENGYCPQPGQCTCSKGYKKSALSVNQCEPLCEPECPQFSTCMQPQRCECHHGYIQNHQTDECELDCDDKIFRPDYVVNRCVLKNCSCSTDGGYCLLDYADCQCYEGFRQIPGNRCEPVCEKSCENAECLGANHCQCWPGYHATSNPYVCEANGLCNGKLCENGECLHTGQCKCKKGFTKSFNFKGQLCETMTVFIGKIMSVILAIPLALALIVLLIAYCVSKRRYKMSTATGATNGEDDGGRVIYAHN